MGLLILVSKLVGLANKNQSELKINDSTQIPLRILSGVAKGS
jgi:hypothetical protein